MYNPDIQSSLSNYVNSLLHFNLSGIYFGAFVLHTIIKDFVSKKEELQLDKREKKKRGRKSRSEFIGDDDFHDTFNQSEKMGESKDNK